MKGSLHRIIFTSVLTLCALCATTRPVQAQVFETVTQNFSDDTAGNVGRLNFFDPHYGNNNTNAEDARIVVPLVVPDSGSSARLVQKVSIELHDHDENLVFDLRKNANQAPNLLSNIDIKTANGLRCNDDNFKTRSNDHHYPQNAGQDADCYVVHTFTINEPISSLYLNISKKNASGATSAEKHVHIRNITWTVEKKETPIIVPEPRLTALSCVVPNTTQQLGEILRVDWNTPTVPITTVAISDSQANNRWDSATGRFWSKETRGATSITAPDGFFPRSPTTPNPLIFRPNTPYSVVLWDGARLSTPKEVTFQACSLNPEPATATLAASCVNRTNLQPLAYTLALSNIDTKGLSFTKASLYLSLEWSVPNALLRNFLGTPTWSAWETNNRQPQMGDKFGYELATYTSFTGNSLSFVWDNTQLIGGTRGNQKRLADLAAWVQTNNVSQDFTVSTSLETNFFGNVIINNPASNAAIKISPQACVQNPVCVPTCDACSLEGSADGCGGTCALGSGRGAPNPVEILSPNLGEPLSVTNNSITLSWRQQPTNNTQARNADAYQTLIYQNSTYASPSQAAAAYKNGAQDVVFRFTPAAQGNPAFVYQESVTLPQVLLEGGKATIVIRSLNLSCPSSSEVYGSSSDPTVTPPNPPPNNPPPDPQWPPPPPPTELLAAFAGKFYTSDSCNLSSAEPLALSSSSVVTITDSQTNQDYSSTAAGANYSIPIPAIQRDYVYPRLKFDQVGQAETLVCSACNPADATGACQRPRTTGPTNTAHFFLESYNLKFNSWWQTRGGLVYGHTGIRSALPVEGTGRKNADCADTGDYCEPYLIRKLPSGSDLSAGIPYTSGSFMDLEGWWTDRLDDARANNGVDAKTKLKKEDYSFFLNRLGENPTPDISTSYIDTLSKIPVGTLVRDVKVSYRNGDLGFNPSQTWTVPAGEKRVIFVNGNLTFSQTPETIITVQPGGFLAFIVSGDIIFDPTVGHTSTSDLVASNSLQPNIEGVFIANGRIILQSAGSDDKKFVGAGSFVGWSGVDLKRTFEKGQLGRIRNNTTPVETFIYRPDFLLNTPELLKSTEMVWREVS